MNVLIMTQKSNHNYFIKSMDYPITYEPWPQMGIMLRINDSMITGSQKLVHHQDDTMICKFHSPSGSQANTGAHSTKQVNT
jgi:hypothetical protein